MALIPAFLHRETLLFRNDTQHIPCLIFFQLKYLRYIWISETFISNSDSGKEYGMIIRCPYLSSESKRKKCTKMIEAELSEEISDSDYEHYCDGNPIYCFFLQGNGMPKESEKSQRRIDLRARARLKCAHSSLP